MQALNHNHTEYIATQTIVLWNLWKYIPGNIVELKFGLMEHIETIFRIISWIGIRIPNQCFRTLETTSSLRLRRHPAGHMLIEGQANVGYLVVLIHLTRPGNGQICQQHLVPP